MTQLLDIIYSVAIVTTLWATAIGFGAGHDLGAVGAGLRRRGLFVRLIALDVVLVPLLVLGLIRLFGVPTEYRARAADRGHRVGRPTRAQERPDRPRRPALRDRAGHRARVREHRGGPGLGGADRAGRDCAAACRGRGHARRGRPRPAAPRFAIHGGLPRHAAIVERWAAPISTFSLAILIGVVLVRDGATALGAIGIRGSGRRDRHDPRRAGARLVARRPGPGDTSLLSPRVVGPRQYRGTRRRRHGLRGELAGDQRHRGLRSVLARGRPARGPGDRPARRPCRPDGL